MRRVAGFHRTAGALRKILEREAKKDKAPVLDFDKPFSQQSPAAKASLEKLAAKLPRNR